MSNVTDLAMLTWTSFCDFYDYLTLHIVPGPRSFSYLFPLLLILISLCTPPHLLSRRQIQWVVLPTTYAVQTYVWMQHRSFDVISMDLALTAFMFLGWYDVRSDFQYVQRLQPHEKIEHKERSSQQPSSGDASVSFYLEPYPTQVSSRLRWVLILMSSMRLTDWHIGTPSHDARQPGPMKPFTNFVLETVTQGVFAYSLLEFTSPYMKASACGRVDLALVNDNLLERATRSVYLLAHFYAALSLFTALLPYLISASVLLVTPSLRTKSLVSPLTWPGHFGPLSAIHSRSGNNKLQNIGLRGFWGTFWHQNMRYITSTPGLALASVMNLKRSSRLRYMIIVTSAFFWSGVVHMGVIPPEPVHTKLGCWQMRFRLASFFWLQILGVAIEELCEVAFNVTGTSKVGADKATRSLESTVTDNTGTRNWARGLAEVSRISLVMVWTIGFLAATAWWTILPVGCEMGWLNLKLLPISLLDVVRARVS